MIDAVMRLRTRDAGRALARAYRRASSPRFALMQAASVTLAILVVGCATAPRGAGAIRVESDVDHEELWNAAMSAVSRRFEIKSAEKDVGRIETEWLIGALSRTGLKSNAVTGQAATEDFLHTIRRRAVVTIARGENPLSVTVERERLVRERRDAVRGGTFSPPPEDAAETGPSRWLPLGRDEALETVLVREITRAKSGT